MLRRRIIGTVLSRRIFHPVELFLHRSGKSVPSLGTNFPWCAASDSVALSYGASPLFASTKHRIGRYGRTRIYGASPLFASTKHRIGRYGRTRIYGTSPLFASTKQLSDDTKWLSDDIKMGIFEAEKGAKITLFATFEGRLGGYFAILPPFCHAQRADYQRVLQNGNGCNENKNFV